jgi:hypothetical protein
VLDHGEVVFPRILHEPAQVVDGGADVRPVCAK